MSRGKRKTPDAVTLGFESDCVTVPVEAVLPVRALSASVKSSRKYRQITASIKEVGLVEPPVVTRSPGEEDTYMLLDGHIRIEVLKDLGIERVECLISTDDEAFTYNKRISRLAPIQEHKMIRKAIERGVSEEKIALALDLNPWTCPALVDLSRFDAAPLIAFTATKEIDYGTETDGRIPPRCGADRTDQWANA